MKTLVFTFCLVVSTAISVSADVPRPKTPGKPVRVALHTRLEIVPDDKIYEAKLQISESDLKTFMAALNATPVQAARIVALAEAMSKDDQPHDATTEDDIEFHLAIAEASGNALFNQIVVSFVPLMRVAVPRAWGTRHTDEEKSDILDRHRRLAWAIANRDPEEAERCMAMHFDEAIGALLR